MPNAIPTEEFMSVLFDLLDETFEQVHKNLRDTPVL